MPLRLNQTMSRRFFSNPQKRISSWNDLTRLLVAYTGGFDRLMKAMVLEGVAGVQPMSWAGRSGAGQEIEKHLGPEAANLLKRGPNLYTEIKRRTERFLPSGLPVTADDLMQQAVMGLNAKNEPKRQYMFYEIGQKVPKQEVLDGTYDWKNVANVATKWMKQRATDVIRQMKRERGRSDSIYHKDDSGERFQSFTELPNETQMGLALHLLSDRKNPRFRKIQDWMSKKIKEYGKRRKKDEAIFLALLENIEEGSPKSEREIAEEMGYTHKGKPSVARIWTAKKNIGKFLADELSKNPKVLEPVWQSLELSQLGYGANPLSRRAKALDPDVLVVRFLRAKKWALSE